MTAEVISAFGTDVVFPICFFGFLAWMVYQDNKGKDGE